jgi:hypothetical protein
MTRKIDLSIEGVSIELDYFVQGFIEHTVSGIIESLEGTGEIGDLRILIQGDEVKVDLNGAIVPLNPFVNRLVKNTIAGMVSSLKGVGSTNGMSLHIERW